MKACSACGCHLRSEGTCPHCGAPSLGARTAAAVLLGLAVAHGGCAGPVQALYGDAVIVTDDDGDGWALEDGDCDDADDTVFPGAEETPGDGIDSNCDDEDDT